MSRARSSSSRSTSSAGSPASRARIVFVEEYDINVARHLVSGVDLWLNNPRRPHEASGTSGQKAGLNGVPNFSVLDGWWCEGYDGTNGWIIGQDREYADETAQDAADALSLYDTLENEIVPLFYDRGPDGIPHGWLVKMRAAMRTVAPVFSLARMLKEYTTRFYIPASRNSRRLEVADLGSLMVEWARQVSGGWPQVAISAVAMSLPGQPVAHLPADQAAVVHTTVRSGPLKPEWLAVELVYGREKGGELSEPRIVPMRLILREGDACHYEAELGPIGHGRGQLRCAHPPAASRSADPVCRAFAEVGDCVTGRRGGERGAEGRRVLCRFGHSLIC